MGDGKTLEDEVEVVEGMKFDRGFISPYFITNSKNQTVELESPQILLVEKKVSNLQQILHLLEPIVKNQSSLLIISEDVEGEALAALVLNKLRAGIKVCAVKAPGFGDNRKATMQDISILTGGTVISEEVGMKLDDVQPDHLGSCKKVTVTKNDTIILDGSGGKESISLRCELIRNSIDTTSSEYEKEKLQERLAKLSGGVGVIRVGGASELEVNEKKDRVVDALNATRAAVEEGIVPGGGKALLHCSTLLEDVGLNAPNMDQRIGVEIIQRALRAPLSTIVNNSGEEGAVVVGELIKKDVAIETGYDARCGVYTNMYDVGIIDPTKVTRSCIVDAASVAGLLTTSEAMICDKPTAEVANATPGGMGGGMGGMGMPGMM